jgi:hypothetical protein
MHTDAEKLPRVLSFPAGPLAHGMNHLDRIARAVINTATAEPALVRIENNRWLSLAVVVDHDIRATDVGTNVAAGAETGIDHHRHDRVGPICGCLVAHF